MKFMFLAIALAASSMTFAESFAVSGKCHSISDGKYSCKITEISKQPEDSMKNLMTIIQDKNNRRICARYNTLIYLLLLNEKKDIRNKVVTNLDSHLIKKGECFAYNPSTAKAAWIYKNT